MDLVWVISKPLNIPFMILARCTGINWLTLSRPRASKLLICLQLRSPSPTSRLLGVQSQRAAQISTSGPRSAKMKAILIKDGQGPAENLYLGEEETPSPQKGQVQIKVGDNMSDVDLYIMTGANADIVLLVTPMTGQSQFALSLRMMTEPKADRFFQDLWSESYGPPTT